MAEYLLARTMGQIDDLSVTSDVQRFKLGMITKQVNFKQSSKKISDAYIRYKFRCKIRRIQKVYRVLRYQYECEQLRIILRLWLSYHAKKKIESMRWSSYVDSKTYQIQQNLAMIKIRRILYLNSINFRLIIGKLRRYKQMINHFGHERAKGYIFKPSSYKLPPIQMYLERSFDSEHKYNRRLAVNLGQSLIKTIMDQKSETEESSEDSSESESSKGQAESPAETFKRAFNRLENVFKIQKYEDRQLTPFQRASPQSRKSIFTLTNCQMHRMTPVIRLNSNSPRKSTPIKIRNMNYQTNTISFNRKVDGYEQQERETSVSPHRRLRSISPKTIYNPTISSKLKKRSHRITKSLDDQKPL